MGNIVKQLADVYNDLLDLSPYSDLIKIQEDFRDNFQKLSDEKNFLSADFAEYCMNIAGTISYVLKDKSNEIPKHQIELLKSSFFDLFTQYGFFEGKIGDYKDFFEEYQNYERARKLLLQLLKTR